MKIFFQLNVGLRFLFELLNTLILIIVGLTGFSSPENLIWEIFVPVIFALYWSLLISPKAYIKINVVRKFFCEFLIYAFVLFYLVKIVPLNFWIFANIYLIVVIANSSIVKVGDGRYQH